MVSSGTTWRKCRAIANMTHTRFTRLQRLPRWGTIPRPLKKKGTDCCADEVTVWMKAPAFKERGEQKLWLLFTAWFWSGFGAAWNSDYAKITFKTIDFVEKRKMKKLYHFISNPIMGLCMLPLAGTAGCNMAAYTEWEARRELPERAELLALSALTLAANTPH